MTFLRKSDFKSKEVEVKPVDVPAFLIFYYLSQSERKCNSLMDTAS